MARDLTPHCQWHELACHDGTPFPAAWEDRARELAMLFERIRAVYGEPLRISSAYRTAAWNTRVGGARRSQHLTGRALDLQPLPYPNREKLAWLYSAAEEVWRAGTHLRGLGYYPWGIHVDLRPGSRTRWVERADGTALSGLSPKTSVLTEFVLGG